MVRAGPFRAEYVANVMGRAEDSETLKMLWVGRGRDPSSENLMSRAGLRLTVQNLRAGSVVAHDMWALCEPRRPAHKAAHVFSRAGPGRGQLNVVYYYYGINPADQAPHVFSRAGPGRGP